MQCTVIQISIICKSKEKKNSTSLQNTLVCHKNRLSQLGKKEYQPSVSLWYPMNREDNAVESQNTVWRENKSWRNTARLIKSARSCLMSSKCNICSCFHHLFFIFYCLLYYVPDNAENINSGPIGSNFNMNEMK